MATKKAKSVKEAPSKAKASTAKASSLPKTATAAKKAAKKTTEKPVTTAQTLLGKLAQRSAQLVLDSGLLGEAPKRPSKGAPAKKGARKA